MYAQDEYSFILGNLSFFLSTKILEEGSITDAGLGLAYNNLWSGDLRFRYTNIEKNEEIPDTDDSLNAMKEKIIEVFFLPVQYRLSNRSNLKFWAGVGLYYEYNKLTEKGFFDMPALENLGLERVNSYTNDFKAHLFGPLLETGINYFSNRLSASFNVGLVPVFFLTASQEMSIVPLLHPGKADYSQNTSGSPRFFLNLETTIFTYINLMLLYDAAWLKYQVIDFDDNLNWTNPDRTVVNQSLKFEASLLLSFTGETSFQIGYGFMRDFVSLNSAPAISEDKHYLILSTKKTRN
jgi:hypothetical protein